MADSTHHRQLVAALASAKALVASLEAAIEQAEHPPDDRVLGLADAAKASGISPHTLRTWCKSGRLRHSTGARGAYLVRLPDVHEALAADPGAPRRTRATVVDLAEWEAQTARELGELVR